MKETIRERLQTEVEAIKKVLAQELSDSSPIFDAYVEPLVAAGGKGLRAKLCLLIALSGPSHQECRRWIASAIELLHLATLVHDDVIDEADLRRGVTTIHRVANNKTAILSGDYLFAKAFDLIAYSGNTQFLKIFTKVIINLVEGEFLQMADIGSVDQSIDRYLAKTQKKTADLIEVAVELGAHMAQYDQTTVQHFKVFGQSLGMLFQITDDIMDYTSTPEKTGKPAGKDLQEGLLTYPLLSIVNNNNHSYIEREVKAIRDGKSPKELMDYVVAEGGLEKAFLLAKEYEARGTQALAALPAFEGKDILAESLLGLMHRTR